MSIGAINPLQAAIKIKKKRRFSFSTRAEFKVDRPFRGSCEWWTMVEPKHGLNQVNKRAGIVYKPMDVSPDPGMLDKAGPPNTTHVPGRECTDL